jgi:AbrB family looped-hinge helix DNA binding protein
MSTTRKTDTIVFTAKGQVVIPARLRKEFQIQAGSKAIVQATPDGILLKPVTGRTIAKLHGILKRKPGDKPFAEEWVEHKRDEAKLEGRRRGHSRS